MVGKFWQMSSSKEIVIRQGEFIGALVQKEEEEDDRCK